MTGRRPFRTWVQAGLAAVAVLGTAVLAVALLLIAVTTFIFAGVWTP